MYEEFKIAVSNQIDRMISESTELFYVEMERDELFEIYLASFPPGENQIFRERTVHDCSCCKRFIRNVGHMVAIIDGQLETIWDVEVNDFYQTIASTLSEEIKFRSIAGIYRHREKTLGGPTNREKLENGIINIYDHYHYILPPQLVSDDINQFRGRTDTNKSLLERSLKEISLEAGELVRELMDQNSLYRGEEFRHIVDKFMLIKTEYDLKPKGEKDMYLWVTSADIKEVGRFKGTVIGTLLHDLSTGTDLEDAVNKFESKVAPTNYKRPTALVTQSMIDEAEKKIDELGIEKSLARRYATPKDLTVNNAIFADKGTKKKMKRGKKNKSILGELKPTKSHDPDKIQKVNIDEFVATILPHAKTVEVMVDNSHMNNMMSVIAPTNSRSKNIMKWDNPFSWSYQGEVTDSIIKQRVRKAGGSVEGFMRCSLSWHNHDDLDIHAIEPDGTEIFYGNTRSRSGGELDVDMNVTRLVRDPVENITWETESNLREGRYRFFVENFTKRETADIGFQVEMELNGKIYTFSYDKPLGNKEKVTVIEFTYTRDTGITVGNALPSTQTSKEVWGIATHEWTRVSMVLNSPNHWNGQKLGNRHFFFILDGCLNPDKTRGFYNEFLKDELRDHRKVFELLASKMKTEHSDKQLSGVGFSSTQENSLLCRVTGKFERTVMITFANNIAGRFGEEPAKLTGETIALCEICKRDVTDIDSRLPCPNCTSVFHTSHFLESWRVFRMCPVCRTNVTQLQVDEIVQLVTV